MPDINFKAGLDASTFSTFSHQLLGHLLELSGNPACLITCLSRTAREQAQVMHDNCLRTSVKLQREIYAGPGQRVIDVFVECASLTAAETVDRMEAAIVEIGPELVSRHCGDQTKRQVFDVSERAETGLTNPKALRDLAMRHGSLVSQCLEENGCLHFIIPQPEVACG